MTTLTEIQRDYHRTFGTTQGQKVLQDLMGKGFANATTFVPTSARLSDINEGRRQMWLHINTMLNLTPEQVIRCAAGLPFIEEDIRG